MSKVEQVITLKSEVSIPSHEQNAIAGAGVEVYRSIVNIKHLNNFAEQLKGQFDKLPVNYQEDDFNNDTWDNIHRAELYVVSKELVDEYIKMKSNK